MICTIDVGNTKTKAVLFDEKLQVLELKTWNTPDLFEPERWTYFLNALYEINPLFFIADLRISCVSWRAFLALTVYLKHSTPSDFDTHRPFNPDLLILPTLSPVISEGQIPVNRGLVTGLIGTDRLLSAYAAHTLFKKSTVLVSLGTATTIDMITDTKLFLSGAILPGIDVSYQGLLSRATSLPDISTLKETPGFISNSTIDALYKGVFIGHALLIESYIEKLIKEVQLQGQIEVVITGGRVNSVSQHIHRPHKIVNHLVNYGLALIPDWKSPSNTRGYSQKIIDKTAKTLYQKDFLKTKNIGV